jgi:RpiR family glv operon transcriptional regulator
LPVDSFEAAEKALPRLNQTERTLFDYVVKNMDKVTRMSIHKLAADRHLSTTTIFRFTQKLGFAGYTDFLNSLLVTSYNRPEAKIPDVLRRKAYAEEYLKNVMETVRVMPADKVAKVLEVLERVPSVFILPDEHASDIGRYCEKLFMSLGLRVHRCEARHQVTAMLDLICAGDLLVALSYTGEDAPLIRTIERVFQSKRPFLLSVTRADNNAVQNMSDVNFYVFADEVEFHGINLTTRASMIMVMELLVYGKTAESNLKSP